MDFDAFVKKLEELEKKGILTRTFSDGQIKWEFTAEGKMLAEAIKKELEGVLN